uniref:two-component regulator propeller domain-containing protein n=1 Tax=Bacteroides nordii TaxID=291645 RepID=UPI002A83A47C|nr:two-component regulator propeller domain-containing protein [Bacteroides nordii]
MGEEISFNHLTTEDGLSNNSVMSMYQDERGFIWIGTRNGVNLYNGRNFNVYQYDKDNSNSLHYNHVAQIVGDRKGTVFFMTSKGVSAFDIKKETFTTLIYNNVLGMYYKEALYISMKNSIYQYNGKEFELYYSLPDKDALINHICLQNDSIMIGTMNKGIYIVGKDSKINHLIPHARVCDLLKDSSGRFWIPTWEHGLYMLQGKTLKNFRCKTDDPSSISSDFVYKCCEDKKGNIWVGTFNGLNLYHNETETFTSYTKSDKRTALSYPSIWSLLCDEQGTIWAGTYYGGINYFNPNNQIYTKYNTSLIESEGLSFQVVGQIIEDKEHHLWICTEGGGLNKFDRTTNTFTWYKSTKVSNSLSHNNVKALFYDRNRNVLWIGTHLGGLNKLDITTGHFTHYLSDPNDSKSLPSNVIRTIVPYQNKLILATNRGIFMFDPETTEGEIILYDSGLHSAIELKIDSRGVLWITGSDELEGIFAYNFSTKKLKRYVSSPKANSISSTVINHIFEDSRKRLWFCTNENGLDLYDPLTDSFENFDKRNNNFASNIIYNICELSQDELLLTTDHGFSIFNLKEKRAENYGKENGLPMIDVRKKSLCKTSDGEIFIGGVDGMFSFKPERLKPVFHSYSILPYQLFINGEKVAVNGQDGILSQSLSLTKRIVLKSHQNRIDIEYAFTDYLPSYREDIVYFLEGFSKSWTSMRSKNTVTYENLSPGKYVLVVKAQGENSNLVPESRLEIEVLPPYYRTIWAYSAYFFCLAILSFYLVRVYKKRIELQESLKYEKKHTEDLEKLNQAKLRFFTDISHEFRTPLTLIIGQIEILLQENELTQVTRNRFGKVIHQCRLLNDLITELIEFRKYEQGHYMLHVSPYPINQYIADICNSFQELASQRNIQIKMIPCKEELEVWFDGKQIKKVIYNLLSNAFKYTPENGTVSITLTSDRATNQLHISITDNGVGIEEKDLPHIFERFYQADNEIQDQKQFFRAGIGLALVKSIVEKHKGNIHVKSQPKQGSIFTLSLQLGKEHLTNHPHVRFTKEQDNTLPLLPDIPLPPNEKNDTEMELLIKQEKPIIVLIEDNTELLEVLVNIFTPLYTVKTAINGQEGLDIIRKVSPNLIVSDIMMPVMTGTELCNIIKNNIEFCHIPIILLTALNMPEQHLKGLLYGADDYICKPFRPQILLARCNNIIRSRKILYNQFAQKTEIDLSLLATNKLDKEFLDKVTVIIDENISNPEFNIDQLAQNMYMGRTSFYTKFKSLTGMSPRDFMIKHKLKQAMILLKQNRELSIKEISNTVGFSTPNYFCRLFKEQFNISPNQFRLKVQEKKDNNPTVECESE